MTHDEIIKDWLHTCNVDSIDDLNDEQCCILYDNLYPQTEAVISCYEDRKSDSEREVLAKDVRKCLTSDSRITVHHLSNEGVILNEEDDKHFLYKYDYIVE